MWFWILVIGAVLLAWAYHEGRAEAEREDHEDDDAGDDAEDSPPRPRPPDLPDRLL